MRKFEIINKKYQNYVIVSFRLLDVPWTNQKRVNIFNQSLFSFYLVSLWL